MWVMSKTVLMILLLGLMVVLTSILHVYQESVIEESARGIVTLWAESANSVSAFTSGTAFWPLQKYVLISGGAAQNTVSREYTAAVTSRDGVSGKRLIFMLAWGTQTSADAIEDVESFSTAVSVALPPEIKHVYFFEGRLRASDDTPLFPLYQGPPEEELLLRPSVGGLRSDTGFIFLRDKDVFCVASKKLGETNTSKALNRLRTCCNRTEIFDEIADDYDINRISEPECFT